MLQEYLNHLGLKGAKAMKAARAKTKRLLEAFGGDRVVDLTTGTIEAWMTERVAAGVARATVSTQAAHLKSALRYVEHTGKVAKVPYIPGLRLNNARKGFFEREEVERLLPELEPEIADLARFAYAVGWRKEEILGLLWADVDRAGGVITIGDTKSGEGRVVPIFGPLVELIEKRWRARAVGDRLSEYVFHRDGQRIGSFNTAWDSACVRAGLPGKLFHDFRRTAVRDMVRAGVPESVAMTISGHKSRAVFHRYNITSVADMREALEKTQAHREAMPRRTIHGQFGQIPAIGAGNRAK